MADELESRKGKENNLVIIGLPESTNEHATDDEEKTLVNNLLKDININQPGIARVFRMGRRNMDRPRPVKVFCESKQHQEQVIQNAKLLKNLPDGHRHKRVYIRPDLTQAQRDQDYKRRMERRRQVESNTSISQTQNRIDHTKSGISGGLHVRLPSRPHPSEDTLLQGATAASIETNRHS